MGQGAETKNYYPLVTVVTPIFNAEKYIAATIESIQMQSLRDWELIMVDDCSQDRSKSIAQSFSASDSRIKVISLEENSGAAVARNTAIEEARGRYIAFLDSDDVWGPSKLERQIDWMEKEGCAFTFTAYEKMDEEGNIIEVVGVPSAVDYNTLLKTNIIGCLTAMYDSRKLGKMYMPLIRKRQDWGLWLKILKQTQYGYGIAEPLAKYRIRAGSVSSNKKEAARYSWRLLREVEGLSWFRAAYCFFHYALRGLLRSRFPGLARRLGVLW